MSITRAYSDLKKLESEDGVNEVEPAGDYLPPSRPEGHTACDAVLRLNPNEDWTQEDVAKLLIDNDVSFDRVMIVDQIDETRLVAEISLEVR